MLISKQSPPPEREKIRLIWTDLEMSGLDPETDVVLEAAFIITDGNFTIIAESEPWVIYQPDSVLNGMDDWNRRTHGASGLIDRCRASSLSAAAAEQEILRFLRQHIEAGESPMCGNSICQDRRFMARELPELERFFHYRNLDVSALKIIVYLLAPEVLQSWSKPPSQHQALADIRDSINEMRHYARHLLPARGL